MTWLRRSTLALGLSMTTLACAFVLPAVAKAAAPAPLMLALVIGNAAYPSLPALPACTASAHVVSTALRRAGFAVTEKLDASNGEMGASIASFTAALKAKPGSSAVLYVCGYDVPFQQRDFLLPASAVIDRDSDALTQGLAAKSVLDAVTGSDAGAGLVLLDEVVTPGHEVGSALASRSTSPATSVGFAASVSAVPPPQGATAFAGAFSAAFLPPNIEAGAVLRAMAARLGSEAGASLRWSPPSRMAWLAGNPAPQPAPASPPSSATAASGATPSAATVLTAMPDEAQMTEADRRRVQAALLRLGYYDKQTDGVFGPDTRAAIRRFQHEIGAEMTGQITPGQSAMLFDKAK